MNRPDAHYAARDIETRILEALRAADLDPEQRLSPEDLAGLDQFHTGGLAASLELLEQARVDAADRVLDIGAGLGGAARLIAATAGCRVDCLEPSPDYRAGATLLNRLTGLDDRIAVHDGDALDLPFPDASFDAVWMQNVGMNISDKRGLYAEIRRVLAPGGRFAFQEMVAGRTPTSYFPLPWAAVPDDSHLAPFEETREALLESGFTLEVFEDTSDAHIARATEGGAPSRLSLSIFVDDLARKGGNARRSLEEGQIRLVRGVFRAT